ncbi:DUF427 domain-containing protein [Limibaculum sp. M0105]|uniref:DUF427 domain-containing protein n=1 Tax=Thermohalobaculum xanthum TaxID=2753746 RepID=A0A8J7M862_9RHOB|nr:DUF427 domain-containing protein [Thermohalobaculum xanthum]MBK0399682.1 DUF427 domain-containing protein [Thermohalobaculum xanthum]
MTDRISLSPAGGTIVVRAGGAVIAESTAAMRLDEAGHAPVFYIPRADIGMEFLDASPTRTVCPHKGEASHFHIMAKSGPIEDAAWSYENPRAGLEAIAGLIAFYPEKAAVEML